MQVVWAGLVLLGMSRLMDRKGVVLNEGLTDDGSV